ncbi:2Fe-2S iron-sulfur cluster binding domain-containing protein [Thiotrichales bacterium 19S11-10]|nr:2Fe-2S iron-sulfur cluster binding domain-containing protein [Thiotrichales bacterium 19S11-10]
MAKISIKTSDGQILEFVSRADETVVAAAKRHGYYLQIQCNQGTCGVCLAKAENRDAISLSGYDKDILNDEDINSGKVLLCCTKVTEDASFLLPYPKSLIRDGELKKRKAIITRLDDLNIDTKHLVLKLDDDPVFGLGFDFEPGQFVQIFMPNTTVCRPYSIANAPGFSGELEFYIKLREGGVFSQFLSDRASIGISVDIYGPSGNFILHDNGLKPRIFVAGGCGLASILSMLRRMAEWQDSHPVMLLFGVWRKEELFALDEIEKIKQLLPQLVVKICVADGVVDSLNSPFLVESGSIIDVLSLVSNDISLDSDIYICGSPQLINASKIFFELCGLSKDYIYHEHFIKS